MDWATIIVAAAVALVFIAILASAVINRKKGKGSCSCGGNCPGCPNKGSCGH